MIAYLNGVIKEIGPESLILSVQGVGYEVFATPMTLNELEMMTGKDLELWIYTHVREDALLLYGFMTREEKDFFLHLLKINGVGPKSALNVIGGAPMQQIFDMIEHEDVKGLSKLPKVGKKTAEQMILSLKGKLVRVSDTDKKSTKTLSSKKSPWAGKENLNLIASALSNLGYKLPDVEMVVSQIPDDMGVQEGVRKGLQLLSKPL